MSENYKFFENIRCEFYPCHKGLHNLNCLFCYCPFYHDMNCGGDFNNINLPSTYHSVSECVYITLKALHN